MRIQICGHRGFFEKYPQNTLPSFEAAIRLGCDRIEYDLHYSADRKLVVCHNFQIDDTSNGKGLIAEKTLEELRSYDFGSWKDTAFAGTRIPLFEEVLDLATKLNPNLFHLIELKLDSLECGEEVIAILRRRNMVGHFTLVSFHLEMLRELKRRHPDICIHGNPTAPLTIDPLYFRAFDSVGLHLSLLTPEVVKQFHHLGVWVDAWTVNDLETFSRVEGYGVDSVTSNNPEILIDYQRRRAGLA